MKVIPQGYGGIEIEAESDADRVWLEQFIGNISKECRKENFAGHLTVDFESSLVMDDDNRPAVDVPIEEIEDNDELNPNGTWGLVDKITFLAFGE